MMSDEFDWQALEEIEDQALVDHAEDPVFYGMRNNEYNPQIHIGCVVENCETLEELVDALVELTAVLSDLDEVGWELSDPVVEGLVFTEWKGEGPPPPEYSMFDKDGNDLAGNHIPEFHEDEDDS